MTDGARPIRAAVVDDEDLARGLVRELLAPHADVTVVAECRDGFEAVKALLDAKPDLVFLDVQMPKLSGFEVLELVPAPPAVVFLTAYEQYALRAFEVEAVDYLLKPCTRERFDAALERARRSLSREGGSGEAPPSPRFRELGERAAPPGARATRIVVRDGATVTVIPVDRVDFVTSEDDYVRIRAAGKEHLKWETLSGLAERVDPGRFVRIHRTCLLNVDRLRRFEANRAILADGTELPVSRTGHARLKELFGEGGTRA